MKVIVTLLLVAFLTFAVSRRAKLGCKYLIFVTYKSFKRFTLKIVKTNMTTVLSLVNGPTKYLKIMSKIWTKIK